MDNSLSLLKLYQSCDEFYAQNTVDAAIQLEQLRSISQQLVSQAKSNPLLLLSQLSLTPQNRSVNSQLVMKQIALLSAIAMAGRWPDDLLFTLFKAILLQQLSIAPLLEKENKGLELSSPELQQLKYPALVTVKHLPELAEKAGVLTLLSQCYGKNKGLKVWQTPWFSQLLSFSWQVARLMLPGAGKLIALEKISALLWLQANSTEQQFWQALAMSEDAVFSTGRFIRDQDANLALLLCQVKNPLNPQLQLQPYSKTARQLTDPILCPAAQWQLLNPRFYSQPDWLQGWQDNQLLIVWPETEPLPALSWLHQLSHAATVKQQTELIAQHPWLMRQLQHRASSLTRQQQKIQSTQHAIAMIGQDQLLPMLKQAWLEQHCQQQIQPLHPWLLEFRRVLAKALYLLTQPVRLFELSEEQASLLAWCLCWPLWQQSELRFIAVSHSSEPLCLASRWLKQQLWQSEHYQHLAQRTLKQFQLSNSWQDACLHYRSLPTASQSHPMAFVLAFAFDLTGSLFSDGYDKARLEHSYKFAQPHLQDRYCSASDWRVLLTEQTQPASYFVATCSFISPFPEVMPQEVTDLSQMSA